MMQADDNRERAFLGFLGSMAAGGFLWWLQTRLRYAVFPSAAFIQPDSEAVQAIAASLPAGSEDSFILDAWDFVGQEIDYEAVGSDITFVNSHVRCLKCHFPPKVLERGKGNCVGASSLLSSILATRIDPARVGMAVGDLALDGIGGHAWSLVQRQDEEWYILEATRAPGISPWVKTSDLVEVYRPAAIITGESFTCQDKKLCVTVSGCRCTGLLDNLWR